VSDYAHFVAAKMAVPSQSGIDVERADLNPALFGYQRDIVAWALRRARAAVFADCGMGKTLMQLAWADEVVRATGGRVLILAPLAVADQTVREGERFGVRVVHVQRPEDTDAAIVITNYDRLGAFVDAQWSGVALDESSILKSYDGATRNAIIAGFAATPYRTAWTATPAPNDHMELGNHAEFLGVKTRVEMLAEYFVHDGGDVAAWRLKGHAEDLFWRWVCSWAAMIRKPSDLGYSDEGFALPDLSWRERVIPVEHRDAWAEGFLFAPDAVSLSDQRSTRRMTLAKRIVEAAAIVAAEPDDQWLIWCELNAEGDALESAIDGAVQVAGAMDAETKTERLIGFAEGRYRVLVTKPSIAGFGMNWQRCARIIFVGASHSYEQTYQAVRRCWRYGQTRDVHAYVLRAETEGAITSNMRRKEADAQKMAEGMLEHMRDEQRHAVRGTSREWNVYEPGVEMTIPAWCQMENA